MSVRIRATAGDKNFIPWFYVSLRRIRVTLADGLIV